MSINKFILKFRAKLALERLASLESDGKFITKFFLGETKYEIEHAKWKNEMVKAKWDFENLKEYL